MSAPDRHLDLTALAVRIVLEATRDGVTHAEPIRSGQMTYKICVTTDRGQAYVVRIYPRGREHVADFEPALLIRMREQGADVPRVVAWSGSQSDFPHVVYERIDGCSLSVVIARLDDRHLERICARMGEQLDLLSGLAVDGFGELADAGSGRDPSWTSFARNIAAQPLSTAVSHRPELEHARGALATIASLRPGPIAPSLVWTDISPENIIVGEGDEFAGLIDFEGAMALEPEATVGYLQARYHGTRFHSFCRRLMKVSEEHRHLPSLYAVVRALRIQPYLRQSLPAGGKRDGLDEFLPGLRTACEELIEWART